MNKAELIERIAEKCGCTKADAERMMDVVIDSITESLKKGMEVAIAGLGKWTVKTRAAREGRNPRTGETVKIPSMRVPKFSAAKALKDSVK